VAQGFHQVEGVDFTQSYAPVAHAAAVRMLMVIATMMRMTVSYVDISQAFLQAPLTETVYCLPPRGFESHPGEAYCMLASLYGLKSSQYNWFTTLMTFLVSYGCQAIGFSGCLYMMRGSVGEMLLIVLYVDDLAIASTNLAFEMLFKKALKKRFECTDDEPITWYLSVHYSRDLNAGTMTASQSKYAQELLRDTLMTDATPTRTPMDERETLFPAEDDELLPPAEHAFYRKHTGRVQYLVIWTRADLAYAMSILAKYVN
jgi:hypothetical protein